MQYMRLGDWAAADAVLGEALAIAERMRQPVDALWIEHNIGYVRARRGAPEEGEAIERHVVERAAARNVTIPGNAARLYALVIAFEREQFARVAEEAEQLARDADAAAPMRALALAWQARAIAALGRPGALEIARLAHHAMADQQRNFEGFMVPSLVLAERLVAAGLVAEAAETLAPRAEELSAIAARIREPAWRASFLEAIPEHAQLLALAARCVGSD